MIARIDICMCTFQRPHVVETLRSVGAIDVPDGVSVGVIVADNDETPSAREMVEALDLPFPLKYVHAPARNISIARNACLNGTDAEAIVFIDDDELVTQNWLVELIAEQARTGADVVLGPALSIYSDDAPDWIREGDFHSSRPVLVEGEYVTGYSCNALVMMGSKAVEGLEFNLSLGQTGGEDSLFFSTVHSRGGKIAYAEDAVVTEEVPPNRATFGWLVQRRLRFGQTHGLLIFSRSGQGVGTRVKTLLTTLPKAGICALAALINLPRPSAARAWFLRGMLHLGVISKMLGGKEKATYGQGPQS